MFWGLLGPIVIVGEKTPGERFDSWDGLIFFAQSPKQSGMMKGNPTRHEHPERQQHRGPE